MIKDKTKTFIYLHKNLLQKESRKPVFVHLVQHSSEKKRFQLAKRIKQGVSSDQVFTTTFSEWKKNANFNLNFFKFHKVQSSFTSKSLDLK